MENRQDKPDNSVTRCTYKPFEWRKPMDDGNITMRDLLTAMYVVHDELVNIKFLLRRQGERREVRRRCDKAAEYLHQSQSDKSE